MNGLLSSIILMVPLLVLLSGIYRRYSWSLVAAAAPPLLASWWVTPGEILSVNWLLLGSFLGTNAITQWLLPASALIWTAVGVHHARAYKGEMDPSRFRLFFILAMSGNLLLLLAQDMLTFYVGFALMGLAGYGLVFRPGSTRARVAANIYLRWTIAGELLLFSGLLSLAQQAGSTQLPLQLPGQVSTITLLLLIAGFGIKIGMPGLHAWMPGAYSASSTAGSAVFSGAMANAGILGLLQFMPLQGTPHTTIGTVLLAMGLLGAFYGILLGLPQRGPKVILAYSSISQLSTLAAMIGLAMIRPELAPALVVAITVYATHHGLTKAALFLAIDGLTDPKWRTIALSVLILLSLMLAGLPFTTGAISKGLIKEAVEDTSWLVSLLTIATIATTLLMTRFIHVCLQRRIGPAALASGFGIGIALSLIGAAHMSLYLAAPLQPVDLYAIWPLLVAMALALGFILLPQSAHKRLQPTIPKGDLPILLARTLQRLIGHYSAEQVLQSLQRTFKQGISPEPTANPKGTRETSGTPIPSKPDNRPAP